MKWPKYRNILMGSPYTVAESGAYNEAVDDCKKLFNDLYGQDSPNDIAWQEGYRAGVKAGRNEK